MSNKYPSYVAGLIVFVALVIFFGGILFLSGKEIFFRNNYDIRIEFSNVAGLKGQSPITMRGFQIGTVGDVILGRDKITVIGVIKREFPVPVDSTAEVSTLNFIGEKAVEIVPGRSTELIRSGGVLKGANRDLMSMAVSVLDAAKAKVEGADVSNVTKKITDLVATFQDMIQSAGDKVRGFDVARLNSQVGEIAKAGEDLRKFIETAQGGTEKFSQQSGESLEKFNGTLQRIDGALQQISDMSAEIKTLTQTINSQGIFASMDTTIKELQGFLADIKKNPKKYVRFSIF
jgi:phospholipid/cholesterol/gamma-HCH transport system substrate-binding protein